LAKNRVPEDFSLKEETMKRTHIVALILLLTLSLQLTSHAQAVPTARPRAPVVHPGAPQASGYITGTVTDEQGQPLSGIGVGAGDFDSVLADCGVGAAWTQTQADGSYQLELSPGDYLVWVNSHGNPAGYVPEAYAGINSWSRIALATRVTVTGGATTPGIDLSLPIGFILTGRLVNSGGQPVLGAGGNLRDPLNNVEFGCSLGFGTSDTDGTFYVNAPAGTYDLSFGLGDVGHIVRYDIVLDQNTDLGDVLFAEASPPETVFDPQVLEPGYQVEALVPGGPNTPSDVAVTADGSIYLAAVRSWNIYQVSAGGTLTSLTPLGVYSLDAGSDGNLYGYFFPSVPGVVYRITPQGDVSQVGTTPGTACESTLAVAPNLDVWIGYNGCGGTSMNNSTIYRLTQAGQLNAVATGLPFGLGGLDFDASGQLYATIGNQLFRVNTASGSLTLLATLPGPTSSHGLEAGPAGEFYVSSAGSDGSSDRIFKVTSGGQVSVLAELPPGCIQGLARLPGGDLLATMRCTGALYRVHPDGTWTALLSGNGMATPQLMAFSLSDELFVVNDESGLVVRIAAGRGEPFAGVVSYITPFADLAFMPSGSFYFSEAAPGFQPRLVQVSPSGQVSEVSRGFDWPSGLAFKPDGVLYVAEYESGDISWLGSGGAATPFVGGFSHPESLAADASGNLYVVAGASLDSPGPDRAQGIRALWKIDAAGARTVLAALQAKDMAFSPSGDLFVTGPVGRQSGILRVAPDGTLTPFATGFLNSVGLAFDLAGDLYVSDDWDNSITRISGFAWGGIQGTVRNAENGQPIPGARLSVVSDYPILLGDQVMAEGDGRYSLPAAPRAYTVTASAPGRSSSSAPITVTAGSTMTLDFLLDPAAKLYLPVILRH
jgi:sugar lactone lactonase YvrE